jgi:hypothetical protein
MTSPAPIMATELASGTPDGSALPIGLTPGDTPTPNGSETLNWLGRIILPREPPVASEVPRLEVKVVVGIDWKELDGGITMSSEKEGAEKLTALDGTVPAVGACNGETKSSEKADAAGVTETAGASSELEREVLETFANIDSKTWHPTTDESCPPCGHDVLEENAGMTITHNPSMRLFINLSPYIPKKH